MHPFVLNNGHGYLCAQVPRSIDHDELRFKSALILLHNKKDAIYFKKSMCKYWSNDVSFIAIDQLNGMKIKMRKKEQKSDNVKIEEFPFDSKNKNKTIKANFDFFMVTDWKIHTQLEMEGRYIDSDYSSFTDLYIGFLNEMYHK